MRRSRRKEISMNNVTAPFVPSDVPPRPVAQKNRCATFAIFHLRNRE